MLVHAHVYALADFLDCPELKSAASVKLKKILESDWDMLEFTKTITEVYNTTNKGDYDIRGALVEAAKIHINGLIVLDEFKEALTKNGEFAGSLVMAMAGNFANCVSCIRTTVPFLPGTARYCSICSTVVPFT